ncbi:hypothetical protein WNY78_17035 [Psychroserpens sp. AS72]
MFNWKTKSEIEQEEKIRRSLAEEYIIDPETGTKLTLEQAESGYWLTHGNEHREIPEEDISKLPYEEQQIVERALNHFRVNKQYLKRDHFENEDFDVLEKSIILSHYDDWTFSSLFSFEYGFIFSPAPETNVAHILTQPQLMLWLRIESKMDTIISERKLKQKPFLIKLEMMTN